MLISEQRKFMFIHVQKTAGTSVTRALQRHIPDLQAFLRPHDPYVIAERQLSADSYFKAAFVRNPFDRLVSWYADITVNTRLLTDAEKEANPAFNRIRQYVLERARSFDEFILHCSDAVDRSGWKPFLYNQADYLADSQGKLVADFIGRFEVLESDFARLCGCIGLPPLSLQRINASKHGAYRAYYTPATRRIVEIRFERDCALFGYRF